ncbi:MAG: GDP-mannose 4,6-dehydratase [Candidatus Aenigmarchaeota archaeon]|nr:GDP-mannose 4,6-dehydratase [Candidatus Aenigmarchaeota archaeon]
MIGVTGCAGFIGSSLTEQLLKNGEQVVGIDNFADFYPKPMKLSNLENLQKFSTFTFIDGDICNQDVVKNFLQDVDIVYHMAGTGGVKLSVSNPSLYFKSNVLSTFTLLNCVRGSDVDKVVYASSSSVYGNASLEDLPVSETFTCNPISPYGWSKFAAETCCATFSKTYSIPTISLRYFTVYGPRQRPDEAVHTFVRNMLNGEYVEIYDDGNQIRNLTYIDDVVVATISAGKSNLSGAVFNIASKDTISVKALVDVISSVVGVRPKIKFVESPAGVAYNTHGDISKARSILGFEPKIPLKVGVERFVEWYKLHNKG